MEEERIENENEINKNSYMTKENFINLLQGLNFQAIESANIHFITGYVWKQDKGITATRGYDIRID